MAGQRQMRKRLKTLPVSDLQEVDLRASELGGPIGPKKMQLNSRTGQLR